ncbi:MAG: DUF4881 domain-containing protein [Thermodesulfovibrionales bacterium]|nr:DUF4881 domain-containing protein [Thermodesulfovibrionales bacterium]
MYCKTFFGLMLILTLILGCTQQKTETVIQGRVLDYDAKTQTVNVIKDKNTDVIRPDYNTLPPEQFQIPSSLIPKGFEPLDGYRIKLDIENKKITIFNPDTKSFDVIDIVIVDKKMNVQRDDDMVYDKNKQEMRAFPIIDKNKETITLYSVRQKIYTTFKVDKKYLDLPPKAWRAGDDIKISYTGDKKIIKYTNITKSDLLHFKSQK